MNRTRNTYDNEAARQFVSCASPWLCVCFPTSTRISLNSQGFDFQLRAQVCIDASTVSPAACRDTSWNNQPLAPHYVEKGGGMNLGGGIEPLWPLLIGAGLWGEFSLEMSQNPHDFTEPVSRTRQMHTGACWDKPRARQMLPKGQKGADVQMNVQASVISSACLKQWQMCTWPQPLRLWGEKCNSWIDYNIFSLPSRILLLWVLPWWHWGQCDLYCPPASATNAGCVLERLFLGFAKCNLGK